MAIYDSSIAALDGSPLDLSAFEDRVLLVVNVASRCGYTPQYAGLEHLYERFRSRGLTVLGVPCNQFGAQEPGTAEEIRSFCSTTYGVSFPLTEKVDVNGPSRHRLYEALTTTPDDSGEAGDVKWNFEKFVVAPGVATVRRFRSAVEPESDELVAAIEAVLPT